MSKYLKQLITDEISQRLDGVGDCLLANVIGLEVNNSVRLRKELRQKNINLLVVKNSMVRRATEGTALATAFEGLDGSLAICWGGDDFVTLVKEVHRLHKDDAEFEAFQTRGGLHDGEQLTLEQVAEISTWPTREEQLSILVGQIIGVGSRLSSQLLAPGGLLSSQLENFPDDGSDDAEATEDATEEAADDAEATEDATEEAADDAEATEDATEEAADDAEATEDATEEAADDAEATEDATEEAADDAEATEEASDDAEEEEKTEQSGE